MTIATTLVATKRIDMALLLVVAFCLGACDVVFGNASQAVVPNLVPTESLNKANGHQNTTTYTSQQFIGPPLGSGLYSLSPALPFGLNAASFVGSALLIRRLPRPAQGASRDTSVDLRIRTGLRWLLANRQLRSLAILLSFNTFAFAMGNSTLVLLATKALRISDAGYGVLLAVAAVGGTIGGLLSARLIHRLGDYKTMLLSLAATILAFLTIGLAGSSTALAPLLAVSSCATAIWNVISLTLRQRLIPDELRVGSTACTGCWAGDSFPSVH